MIRVKLHDCAVAIPAGYRIRLSLSTAAWPTAWPSQHHATLTLRTDESALILPVRRPRREDAAIRFEPRECHPAAATKLSERVPERRFALDVVDGTATYMSEGDAFGEPHILFDAIATEYAHHIRRDFRIATDRVEGARQDVRHSVMLACEGRRFRVEVTGCMTATADTFRLAARVEALEDDRPFAERRFEIDIPRDLI